MEKVWVFDIDNTLADVQHRWHYLSGENRDWKGWFADQHKDEPHQAVFDVLHALAADNQTVLVVTAREERFREETLEWLNRHINFFFDSDSMLMRPNGEREDDTTLKIKMIRDWLSRRPLYKIGGIFEDRHRIIDAFREEGWYTFECNQQRLTY